MRDQMWTREVIDIEMWGCFTTHHRLYTETDTLGELTLPALSYDGLFESADGRELRIEKVSWWQEWYEMKESGVVIGSARLQGFWSQVMSIGFRGLTYELVPAGFWKDGWNLHDVSGNLLLEVWRRGFFRRQAGLTIGERASQPGALHLDLIVFAYFLANARWRAQAAAAVAATGAAAGS